MTSGTSRIRSGHIYPILLAFAGASVVASPRIDVPFVAPAALQAMLPMPDGWTKTADTARQTTASPECEYTVAFASYSKGEARAKVTLADSGSAKECLAMLTPMIAALPEDHAETIATATIARSKHELGTAAERWDGTERVADIEVLIGGRFVIALEGHHLESLDDLRGVLNGIDLKKFAAMK